MTTKKSKLKKCKNCGKEFQPKRPLQAVCSTTCAYEYTCKLKEKEQEKNKAELVKAVEKAKDVSVTQTLQMRINKIIRLIDDGCECMACGKPISGLGLREAYNKNAAHFHDISSNPELRFHLMNIWINDVKCNRFLDGNKSAYHANIAKLPEQVYNHILDLPIIYKGLKLMKHEKEAALFKTRKIIKDLEAEDKKGRSIIERIELRKRINHELNLYQ